MICFVLLTTFQMWFYEERNSYEKVKAQEQYVNVTTIRSVKYNPVMKKVQLNIDVSRKDTDYLYVDLTLEETINKLRACK